MVRCLHFIQERKMGILLQGPERQKAKDKKGCVPWSSIEILARRVVENETGTSLMVQWLRFHLPTQETQVQP